MLACAAVLPACHTNVGAAAYFDGHRISESTVANYLTPAAQPVPVQDSTGAPTGASIPPRTEVLQILISSQLITQVLATTSAGAPDAGALAAAQATLLQGQSASSVIDQVVKLGYHPAFAAAYLHEQSLEQILGTDAQAGLDVNATLAKLAPKVSVNPRYGTWDPTSYQLSSTTGVTVPGYLTVQPAWIPPTLGS